MAFIPFAAFVIGLLETLLVFGLFWIPFRLANGRPSVRNWTVYVASYPGTVVAVGGWIGVVVPVPAILGVPLMFLTGQLSGGDDAGWFPAPLMNYALGFEGPTNVVFAFVAGELALLIAWGVAVRYIHTRCGNRL